jgi:hypothetical protein
MRLFPIVYSISQSERHLGTKRSFPWTFAARYSALLLASLFIALASHPTINFTQEFSVAIFLLGMPIAIYCLLSDFYNVRAHRVPRLLSIGNVTLDLFLLLMSITFYARVVYPILPRELGGGEKPRVLLLLSEPATKRLLTSEHIPLSEDGKVIGPVRLLLETSEIVAIAADSDQAGLVKSFGFSNAHAIELNRNLVGIVEFLPMEAEGPSVSSVAVKPIPTSAATGKSNRK